MKNNFRTGLFFVFIFFLTGSYSFCQPNPVMNSSGLKLALDKLNVLGSVLYIAAHPDDENNALLAYLAKDRKLRTGYLSLTRGDGGQNLVGTEQGDMLGVLRTQELLAARRIDGAEQFFSRAIDFGFSKSAKETLDFWGKEKILSDIVWIIRKFRPDVIITRFQGTKEDGHGNHTASEILAAEAFKISGDSTKFPEQLEPKAHQPLAEKYVKPWQAKRIVWNAWLPILKRHNTDLSKLVKINVGAYNPMLGESYTEIAAKARSMHKSQGFGSRARLGNMPDYFVPINGKPAGHDIFEGINLTWSRVTGGKMIGALLKEADEKFNPSKPEEIIPVLLKAYKEMQNLKNNYWIPVKEKELLNVIRSCAGIWIESFADDYSAVPGEKVEINSHIINRSSFPFTLKKVEVTYQKNSKDENIKLTDNEMAEVKSEIEIPDDAEYSQPYWLRKPHGPGDYVVDDQTLIGKPENDPALTAVFYIEAGNEILKFNTPVIYRWTDPVNGEEFRDVVIVPPAAINIEDKVYLFPSDGERKINITLTANESNVSGMLKLNVPQGWEVAPSEQSFTLKNKNDELPLTFSVKPPKTASVAELSAEAVIGGRTIDVGMVSINHSYIPIQTLFPKAQTKLIRLDIKKVINNIGYIMGPGDKVPNNLTELGYNVTMLKPGNLATANLSKFDAIITGIRLYNTNPQMEFEQPELLNYVKDGGTLVVQYNKNFDLVTNNIGPYPFHISAERVTDETSKVTFTDPESSLLNYPNKITGKDFDGWIQERGVYFADTWDPEYKTVIECSDPGEQPLKGGIIYAHYGKGVFVYTGYDWFRELPAGVPGAYRIFVNLISAGKAAPAN